MGNRMTVDGEDPIESGFETYKYLKSAYESKKDEKISDSELLEYFFRKASDGTCAMSKESLEGAWNHLKNEYELQREAGCSSDYDCYLHLEQEHRRITGVIMSDQKENSPQIVTHESKKSFNEDEHAAAEIARKLASNWSQTSGSSFKTESGRRRSSKTARMSDDLKRLSRDAVAKASQHNSVDFKQSEITRTSVEGLPTAAGEVKHQKSPADLAKAMAQKLRMLQ